MTSKILKVSDKIEQALNRMLKGTVPVISSAILQDCINSDSDWILLDSREFVEFEVSHLPNAKWIGHSQFHMHTISCISKKANIVVYCSIGVRSEQIAEELIASGFSNVWNLYGGIFTWANENKLLVNQYSRPTLAVHGYDKKWCKLLQNHMHSIL